MMRETVVSSSALENGWTTPDVLIQLLYLIFTSWEKYQLPPSLPLSFASHSLAATATLLNVDANDSAWWFHRKSSLMTV